MELRQLRSFRAIVATGSFGFAAEQLRPRIMTSAYATWSLPNELSLL